MAKRGRGEHGRRLSSGDREELERRIAAGETQEDVAGAIGCDVRTVIRWIMHNGGLRSYERKRSPRRLSLAEREEIAVGIARGTSGVVIGRGGGADSGANCVLGCLAGEISLIGGLERGVFRRRWAGLARAGVQGRGGGKGRVVGGCCGR